MHIVLFYSIYTYMCMGIRIEYFSLSPTMTTSDLIYCYSCLSFQGAHKLIHQYQYQHESGQWFRQYDWGVGTGITWQWKQLARHCFSYGSHDGTWEQTLQYFRCDGYQGSPTARASQLWRYVGSLQHLLLTRSMRVLWANLAMRGSRYRLSSAPQSAHNPFAFHYASTWHVSLQLMLNMHERLGLYSIIVYPFSLAICRYRPGLLMMPF